MAERLYLSFYINFFCCFRAYCGGRCNHHKYESAQCKRDDIDKITRRRCIQIKIKLNFIFMWTTNGFGYVAFTTLYSGTAPQAPITITPNQINFEMKI